MAQKISRAAIFETLGNTFVAGSATNIVAMKAVKSIEVEGGSVQISIALSKAYEEHWSELEKNLKTTIEAIPGVEHVVLSINWETTASSSVMQNLLPTVKNVVVVASGKGGVGKSTVAANLACALAKKGHRVGLMDADIYGPSMGIMFGVEDSPYLTPNDKVAPIEKYGLKLMSMAFLIEEDRPIIWRGPMLNKALVQFMEDVDWGELDILFVDLPPGTGDIHISIIHSANVCGAVIVSTPQDVAFLDAKKAISMFRTVHVPILGIIENMSSFICPKCKEETQIFGHGGVRMAALELGLPFLGEIPIDLQIRKTGDMGMPIVANIPENVLVGNFYDMAGKLEKVLSLRQD